MRTELDLSLPNHSGETQQKPSKHLIFINILILIAVAAQIAITIFRPRWTEPGIKAASLSSESSKNLALKLEKQGLNEASVSAWKEYLSGSSIDDREAAKIWYRIGKLYQKDSQCDKALESFYRSESFANLADVSTDISRHIEECLESMGKFSALRYELENRTGMERGGVEEGTVFAGDQVVAEIGPQKITKADLDRWIELQIDRQLAQLSSYLTDQQRKEQKEKLLKQFSTSSRRLMFLNRFILEEVLYRKALESKLMDNPEVRAELKARERAMLAGKMIEKRFKDEINITTGDLETWYEAHKKEYIRPQRAKISHILVPDIVTAEKARKLLREGKEFADVAAALSLDSSTKEKGGEISNWIEKNENGFISGIGNADDAMRLIFSTDAGRVVEKNIKTAKGIHIIKVRKKEKEYQQTFNEVRNEVFRALRSRKEHEVQEKLLNELKEKYNVVIHRSAFSRNATGEEKTIGGKQPVAGRSGHEKPVKK